MRNLSNVRGIIMPRPIPPVPPIDPGDVIDLLKEIFGD